LEVAVPRREPQVFVKHDDAIGHVVEGDAQFGLPLADFIEQPCILDGDYRLGREVLEQSDLLVGKWPDFLAVDEDIPEESVVPAERDGENRAPAGEIDKRSGEGVAKPIIFARRDITEVLDKGAAQ
jgi:hypothetical protein